MNLISPWCAYVFTGHGTKPVNWSLILQYTAQVAVCAVTIAKLQTGFRQYLRQYQSLRHFKLKSRLRVGSAPVPHGFHRQTSWNPDRVLLVTPTCTLLQVPTCDAICSFERPPTVLCRAMNWAHVKCCTTVGSSHQENFAVPYVGHHAVSID